MACRNFFVATSLILYLHEIIQLQSRGSWNSVGNGARKGHITPVYLLSNKYILT